MACAGIEPATARFAIEHRASTLPTSPRRSRRDLRCMCVFVYKRVRHNGLPVLEVTTAYLLEKIQSYLDVEFDTVHRTYCDLKKHLLKT